MASKTGQYRIICDVLAIDIGNQEMSKERISAFNDLIKELDYSEMIVIRHLTTNYNFKHVAKILDVPKSYVLRKYKRAIRRLRAPIRYFKLLYGIEEYEEWHQKIKGSKYVTKCGFSTRVANALIKNGIRTIEELEFFIGNVPERFAYIEGLGKFGMSEVLYYYNKHR